MSEPRGPEAADGILDDSEIVVPENVPHLGAAAAEWGGKLLWPYRGSRVDLGACMCKCMERQLQNSFDQVVGALTSNDGTYADEIVMIFERPLE